MLWRRHAESRYARLIGSLEPQKEIGFFVSAREPIFGRRGVSCSRGRRTVVGSPNASVTARRWRRKRKKPSPDGLGFFDSAKRRASADAASVVGVVHELLVRLGAHQAGEVIVGQDADLDQPAFVVLPPSEAPIQSVPALRLAKNTLTAHGQDRAAL